MNKIAPRKWPQESVTVFSLIEKGMNRNDSDKRVLPGSRTPVTFRCFGQAGKNQRYSDKNEKYAHGKNGERDKAPHQSRFMARALDKQDRKCQGADGNNKMKENFALVYSALIQIAPAKSTMTMTTGKIIEKKIKPKKLAGPVSHWERQNKIKGKQGNTLLCPESKEKVSDIGDPA